MKTKSKMVTAMVALTIAFLVLAGAIVIAIFAASNQKVLSNISVTYSAEGINANVSAKYYVGDSDNFDMTTNGTASGNKVLNFAKGKETNPNTLNPQGTIELTSKKSFVVFEYKFENLGVDFEANLSYNGIAENLQLFSAEQSTEQITDFSQIETSIARPEEFSLYAHLSENEVKYVYLKVQVWKMEEDANFNGQFEWDLTLDLSEEIEKTFKISSISNSYRIDGFQDNVTMQDLIIPEHYKGKPITAINDNAFKSTSITSITISDTLTTVAYSTSSSTSNVLPSTLTKIYYTKSLRSWCETPLSNLNKFLSSSNQLYVKENGDYKLISGNLVIPDDVNSISLYKFYYRPITSVTIGENVNYLGNGAFEYCYNLTKINFNAISVSDLSSNTYVFDLNSSTNAVDVVFGDKVQRIPTYLFYNNYITIKNITFGKNVESIGSNAFSGSDRYGTKINVTSIHIVKTISIISYEAFSYWPKLNEIILDSDQIYMKLTSNTSNGKLTENLTSQTGKIKVLADIDTGNEYLNSSFTKQEGQEEIDGQMYNVYTKN